MNRKKLASVLTGIVIAAACAITGLAHAEEVSADEASTITPTSSGKKPATVWDKTRKVSGNAWEHTREGSEKAWDRTKEVSADAWDATRDGTANVWNKTKTAVQGWQETKSESETDSGQETPASAQ